MKVTVDKRLCEDHGQCAIAAPVAFRINDEGKLEYDEQPDESRFESRRRQRRLPGASHPDRRVRCPSHIAVVGAVSGRPAGRRAAPRGRAHRSDHRLRRGAAPALQPAARCPRRCSAATAPTTPRPCSSGWRSAAAPAWPTSTSGSAPESSRRTSPGPCTWPMGAVESFDGPGGRHRAPAPKACSSRGLARVAMSCARSTTASRCGPGSTDPLRGRRHRRGVHRLRDGRHCAWPPGDRGGADRRAHEPGPRRRASRSGRAAPPRGCGHPLRDRAPWPPVRRAGRGSPACSSTTARRAGRPGRGVGRLDLQHRVARWQPGDRPHRRGPHRQRPRRGGRPPGGGGRRRRQVPEPVVRRRAAPRRALVIPTDTAKRAATTLVAASSRARRPTCPAVRTHPVVLERPAGPAAPGLRITGPGRHRGEWSRGRPLRPRPRSPDHVHPRRAASSAPSPSTSPPRASAPCARHSSGCRPRRLT